MKENEELLKIAENRESDEAEFTSHDEAWALKAISIYKKERDAGKLKILKSLKDLYRN